ncbi:hypothetical protein ACAW74_15455 [Fibrella sp. WM1]|uniref:hypothetical protein n=1 Tax=Fibrella musci TaxID=3242485 RepID=UPI003522459E
MQTLTVDILNEKALQLLHDLESLQLIRVRQETSSPAGPNWAELYKGRMAKQPLADVDAQLDQLRSEWE